MLLDKTTALEYAKKYAQLVGEQLHPLKIVLFGLYANRNYTINGDIDITMIVNKIEEYFLSQSTKLNKLHAILIAISNLF